MPLDRSHVSNTTYTAQPGDLVFSEAESTQFAGAILDEPVDQRVVLVRHEVPAGTSLFPRQFKDTGDTVYCTYEKTVMDAVEGPWRYSCFADSNASGEFDQVGISARADFSAPAELSPPAPYTLATVTEPGMAFRYDVRFIGQKGGELHFETTLTEQQSNCVTHSEPLAISSNLSAPQTVLMPPPIYLQADAGGKAMMKDVEDSFNRLRILGWDGNELRYTLELKPIEWRMGTLKTGNPCATGSADE